MSEIVGNVQKTYRLEGMSCSACAVSIESTLRDQEGVLDVHLDVVREQVTVDFQPDMVSEDTLLQSIRAIGYGMEPKTDDPLLHITLRVEGMTCASCVSRVEQTLDSIPGVSKASVNLASGKAAISYDPKTVRLSELKEQVSRIGYSLEESTTDDADADDAKMQRARRRMGISAVLAGTVMALMMIHMFIISIPFYLGITALIGFPVVFIIGAPVHLAAFRTLKSGRPNMDVLVSLGSLPPYVIGLAGFFFPIQTFIEMSVTIMTFHLIGKYLETRAKGRASQAIRKLVNLGAKRASIILPDGKEMEVDVQELSPGDVMIIRPGEKVPTDGVVVSGSSYIDESMATGEPVPLKKEPGTEVIGATINKQGVIRVRVTKVGQDTFLSQVIKLVDQCQGSKVPIQEFADRVTGYFVPVILLLTGLTFASFNIFPDMHRSILEWGASFLPWINPALSPLTLSFITATAVLVIACPCALGLGTPTALMVGSGIGAEHGILIRNGEAVQTLKDVKVVAFDKTGTITQGTPAVTDMIPAREGITEEELLLSAASLEHGSEHPLAQAVINAAEQRGISLQEVDQFESITGKGVRGVVEGSTLLAGSRRFLEESGISNNELMILDDAVTSLEKEAKTVILVAADNSLIGIIAVADPIKETSSQAVRELHDLGIKTALITGDNERTARAIASQIGITHIISGVLPDGKVDEVRRLQETYGITAMVGDGINDAPALTQAHVGIAVGTGTDIAIEASDVTIVRGDLLSVVSSVKLSKAIFRKIKENYFWAWFYNAVAIPIAMLGLLHPMIGAAAMSMSSLNVVYNSLRLRRVKLG